MASCRCTRGGCSGQACDYKRLAKQVWSAGPRFSSLYPKMLHSWRPLRAHMHWRHARQNSSSWTQSLWTPSRACTAEWRKSLECMSHMLRCAPCAPVFCVPSAYAAGADRAGSWHWTSRALPFHNTVTEAPAARSGRACRRPGYGQQ